MFLFVSRAKLQPFFLVHPGLASISTSQLHRMPEFLTVFFPSSTFFRICTKSTATLTCHGNFMLVVIFSGCNSKLCHGRARNSSVVESQSYFVLDGVAFFPIPRATSQIRQQGTSPYSLLWENGLLAIVVPNDAHQAATKDEKWLLSYQKSHTNQTPAVINSSTKQSDYVRMTLPENLSLQCFRTAALSMVKPDTELQNPMDCLICM